MWKTQHIGIIEKECEGCKKELSVHDAKVQGIKILSELFGRVVCAICLSEEHEEFACCGELVES